MRSDNAISRDADIAIFADHHSFGQGPADADVAASSRTCSRLISRRPFGWSARSKDRERPQERSVRASACGLSRPPVLFIREAPLPRRSLAARPTSTQSDAGDCEGPDHASVRVEGAPVGLPEPVHVEDVAPTPARCAPRGLCVSSRSRRGGEEAAVSPRCSTSRGSAKRKSVLISPWNGSTQTRSTLCWWSRNAGSSRIGSTRYRRIRTSDPVSSTAAGPPISSPSIARHAST